MTPKPPSVKAGASDDITATAPPEDEDPGSDAVGAGAATPGSAIAEGAIAVGQIAVPSSDESKAAAESYDDSLEAILLQASARPPEQPAAKILGSKTLMGIGIEALNLSAILAKTRAGARSESQADDDDREGAAGPESTPHVEALSGGDGRADADEKTASGQDDLVETAGAKSAGASSPDGPREAMDVKSEELAKAEAKLAATIPSDEKPVASLLDEVAQALNVQASEYRDRARGRLPGMPSPNAAAATVAAFSRAGAPRTDAEFEDPDDGPTALTPGMISVVDEHDEADADLQLAGKNPGEGEDDSDESVVLGPAAFGGDAAARPVPAKADSRSGPVPPVPGHPAAATASPVGPPPGVVARNATPVGGLPAPPSGRVHLPTPLAGTAAPARTTAPSPPIGRLTLPLGAPNPNLPNLPNLPMLGAHKDSELTATSPSTPISLETSRRVAAGIAAGTASGQVSSGSGRVSPGSGRVTERASGRITEPVRQAISALPGILTAHVKLATVSLAGLVAVTFAGGLLVGMLVWKGQARSDGPAGGAASAAATDPEAAAPTPAPSAPAAPAAQATAPSAPPSPTTTASPASPSPTTTAETPPAPAGSSTPAAAEEPVGMPTEAIVTPLVADTESAISEAPPSTKPTRRAASRPPRPKAPVVSVAAETPPPPPKIVAAKPAIRPAASPASKPMAANGAAKPAPKPKAKPAWHDPFAD